MLAHRLLVVMMGLLAMKSAATHPLLSLSTLFVSEEEEGLVRNIKYVDQLHSSEEVSTKTSDNFCATISLTNLPPNIFENSYEIFAKVLVRDSRKVTVNKLREVKAMYANKETSIGYFFVMRRAFRKVNVTWEGKPIYNAIREIAAKTNNSDNTESKTAWLDHIIERVVCVVLRAEVQRDTDHLVDQITFEKEISEHFDVFKQFWLDYAKSKRSQYQKYTTSAPITEKKQANENFSCVINILEFPLITANITYSVFAEVLIRDSQIVIERKLKESEPVNTVAVYDLSTMLRNIKRLQIFDANQQGKLMYQKLQKINRERDEENSFWQTNLRDRIFCYAQEVRSESDFRSLVGKITMTDTIKEHFDIFKHFWLNDPNSYDK